MIMHGELEMIEYKSVVAYFKVLHLDSLERLNKTTESTNQYTQWSSRDSNSVHYE
jgi:hypothetical protein